MPIFALEEDNIAFPPPEMADPDGVLAVGGDLSPRRLILAYSMGIFPWYSDDEPIVWWSPDPRSVMFPKDLKISKSMKQVLKKGTFTITFDQDFKSVIAACGKTYRPNQFGGTWITSEMLQAYCQLHELGLAHSVEVWNDQQELVGGLYGIALGKCFFGESMFTRVSNASKTGYIALVQQLIEWDYQLIDCQVHNNHLESLGSQEIPRKTFLSLLEKHLQHETLQSKWTFTRNSRAVYLNLV